MWESSAHWEPCKTVRNHLTLFAAELLGVFDCKLGFDVLHRCPRTRHPKPILFSFMNWILSLCIFLLNWEQTSNRCSFAQKRQVESIFGYCGLSMDTLVAKLLLEDFGFPALTADFVLAAFQTVWSIILPNWVGSYVDLLLNEFDTVTESHITVPPFMELKNFNLPSFSEFVRQNGQWSKIRSKFLSQMLWTITDLHQWLWLP